MDALVAAAIHDAKNALMALDSQLDAAQRHPASADFSAARAGVARIAGQLTELLALYRAQGGQLHLAIDDHDLVDFIDDLLAELGPLPATITLAVDRAAAVQLGAWAFDAVSLMNEAVTKAGSTDKEAVRSAFESITGFYGVAGQYNYSADDHIGIHGGMWLFQIEKGEYKLIGDAAVN